MKESQMNYFWDEPRMKEAGVGSPTDTGKSAIAHLRVAPGQIKDISPNPVPT